MAKIMGEQIFTFGKNWRLFARRYLNQERIDAAKRSLIGFCDGQNLIDGKTFVDVGCGSGLFSLAAYQLGASRILSFDNDMDSVECCKYLREKEGNPINWRIIQGSILDEDFVSKLEEHDFVYSWGVLHHTGNMREAIKNTLKLVAHKGLLYLAIYNKADTFGIYSDGRFGHSRFWVKEKKLYSRLPMPLQDMIDYTVMSILVLLCLLTLRNPIKKIRSHEELRGMAWRTEIKDWLGGYPYEYASIDEIFNFVHKLGFSLENLKSNNGLKNNEYLFKRYEYKDHDK